MTDNAEDDDKVELTVDMRRVVPAAQAAAQALMGMSGAEKATAIALIAFAVSGRKNAADMLGAASEMLPQLLEAVPG